LLLTRVYLDRAVDPTILPLTVVEIVLQHREHLRHLGEEEDAVALRGAGREGRRNRGGGKAHISQFHGTRPHSTFSFYFPPYTFPLF
jgi:hypothetical protein